MSKVDNARNAKYGEGMMTCKHELSRTPHPTIAYRYEVELCGKPASWQYMGLRIYFCEEHLPASAALERNRPFWKKVA